MIFRVTIDLQSMTMGNLSDSVHYGWHCWIVFISYYLFSKYKFDDESLWCEQAYFKTKVAETACKLRSNYWVWQCIEVANTPNSSKEHSSWSWWMFFLEGLYRQSLFMTFKPPCASRIYTTLDKYCSSNDPHSMELMLSDQGCTIDSRPKNKYTADATYRFEANSKTSTYVLMMANCKNTGLILKAPQVKSWIACKKLTATSVSWFITALYTCNKKNVKLVLSVNPSCAN